MSQVKETLHNTLTQQDFSQENDTFSDIEKYKWMAKTYATIENAIAVLSDLKEDKSYIYHGALATELGLESNQRNEIESIWEEDIFAKMHPEDLLEKHVLELQFFQFLKKIPIENRHHYYTTCRIRMQNHTGKLVWVQHRMYYVANFSNSIWLALCLYNILPEKLFLDNYPGQIVHSFSGIATIPNPSQQTSILSLREIEVLQLIRQGKLSKEVAQQLSISINTVNRHRQNILEKLRVDNSIEACRVAEKMQLINHEF
ncbi:MAG: helix-turn-helix transcriptional regulator [Pseudopedobacter saltans]|uniref:Helix-turn-helix transcriptional regulator n=1 Tax=Pseudopedobacter saltans TaxID=151895 RepID=A0A2W5F2H7_9SPHI|nr:MAG: helix-turn-helix transcriptional regulator [Pseudopedobacter saltans]